MAAIINEARAATSTAAAAISLTALIFIFFAGDTKSASFSTAELIISSESTRAITIVIEIHSIDEMLKNMPAATAKTAANRCILKLCSFINTVFNPLKA